MKKLLCILILFSAGSAVNTQWVRVSNGMGNNVSITSLAVISNNIFAGTRNSGVFLSTNNGANWTQTSLGGLWITSLAVIGSTVYAGNFGIYVSTNNGANWNFSTLYNRAVYSLSTSRNSIFAGTTDYNNNPYGVYTSRDNGSNWSQTSFTNRIVYSLAIDSNNIFAGTGDPGYGVYKSTNSGKVWSQTPLNNRDIRSLAVKGNYVFAGTYDYTGNNPHGVYISTDTGASWMQSSLNNADVFALAVNGDNIFAGGDHGSYFYASSDNGVNWLPWNNGMSSIGVLSLCIFNNYIYAGTFNNGVYRRPLSDFVDVHPNSAEIPEHFSLSQNYPNPFNPTTNIEFSVPKSGFVNLTIYDALGNTIEVLQNSDLSPGTYKADWNAAKYPSGIYFYRIAIHSHKLTAGDFIQTKKMILIK